MRTSGILPNVYLQGFRIPYCPRLSCIMYQGCRSLSVSTFSLSTCKCIQVRGADDFLNKSSHCQGNLKLQACISFEHNESEAPKMANIHRDNLLPFAEANRIVGKLPFSLRIFCFMIAVMQPS